MIEALNPFGIKDRHHAAIDPLANPGIDALAPGTDIGVDAGVDDALNLSVIEELNDAVSDAITQKPIDVLIVGAGPAGASLAWQLGSAGLRVTLIDRQAAAAAETGRPPFRGEALMPSGLAALEAMGLADLLPSLPTRPLSGWRFQVEGQPLFEAAEPWGDPRPCTLVPQDDLLGAILDRCRQLATVTIALGQPVIGLLQAADQSVCGVRLADGHGLRARLVVAADGRHSTLRRLAGLELDPGPGPELIVDWFALPNPPAAASPTAETTFLSVIAGGELFSCFEAARGDARHLALVREPQDPEPTGGDRLAAQLAKLAPEELATLLQGLDSGLPPALSLQVRVAQARSWHRPGLLLLGDAAHPMSPVRAQGLNMALRDALIAARSIQKALTPAADQGAGRAAAINGNQAEERRRLNAALAAIEARRRPEISRMQRLQAQETRRGLLLRRQPLLRALLATAAPWLGARLRHHWMTSQLPLRLGLDDLSDDGGSPGSPMVRPSAASPALALALLLGAGITASLAKPLPPLQEPPSTESLRAIQLSAQICARDNTAAACARTRELADPLLDHGTVSASCKDSAYELIQRAKVGEGSSYTRRDRIEASANDLVRLCRPKTRPVGDGSSGSGSSPGKSTTPFSLRGEPQPGL